MVSTRNNSITAGQRNRKKKKNGFERMKDSMPFRKKRPTRLVFNTFCAVMYKEL